MICSSLNSFLENGSGNFKSGWYSHVLWPGNLETGAFLLTKSNIGSPVFLSKISVFPVFDTATTTSIQEA